MTARGAADFLTRATSILGGLFIVLSILLAAIAGVDAQDGEIDTSLVNQPDPDGEPAPLGPEQPRTGPLRRRSRSPAVPLAQ